MIERMVLGALLLIVLGVLFVVSLGLAIRQDILEAWRDDPSTPRRDT